MVSTDLLYISELLVNIETPGINMLAIGTFKTVYSRQGGIIIIDNSNIKPTKFFLQPNNLKAMHSNGLNPLCKIILATLAKIEKRKPKLFLLILINLKTLLIKLLAI